MLSQLNFLYSGQPLMLPISPVFIDPIFANFGWKLISRGGSSEDVGFWGSPASGPVATGQSPWGFEVHSHPKTSVHASASDCRFRLQFRT